MIVLEIPDSPPSLNRLLRLHWTERKVMVDKWKRFVWAARCQRYPVKPQPLQRARIHIRRIGRKLMDPDNAVGACKLIIDGLRADNLIVDDTPEHIELTVTQSRGTPEVIVKIEEMT